jgi:hypothetical protein
MALLVVRVSAVRPNIHIFTLQFLSPHPQSDRQLTYGIVARTVAEATLNFMLVCPITTFIVRRKEFDAKMGYLFAL